MLALALGVLALMPLSLAQQRFNTFIGCVSEVTGTQFPQGLSLTGPPQNAEQCATTCSRGADTSQPAGTITYSFFRDIRAIGQGLECTCSVANPSAGTIGPSVAGSPFVCVQSLRFQTWRLRTTYRFDGCYPSAQDNVGTAFTSASINQCFDQCASTPGVLISANTNTGQFTCRCLLTRAESTGNTQQCRADDSVVYGFRHTEAAASAGLNRRKRARALSGREEFCPAGLTACKVDGSAEAYECIDTSSELESCGGCLHGEYRAKTEGPEGVNCASLVGDDFMSLAAMTCRRGECVVEV